VAEARATNSPRAHGSWGHDVNSLPEKNQMAWHIKPKPQLRFPFYATFGPTLVECVGLDVTGQAYVTSSHGIVPMNVTPVEDIQEPARTSTESTRIAPERRREWESAAVSHKRLCRPVNAN